MRAIKDGADEQFLVEEAQRDPRRFGQLYQDNFNRIYAYVAHRVRSREEAEDVTAEVFHQALANIAKFEWRGTPFVAWLLGIAANVIASRWRNDPADLELSTDDFNEPSVDEQIEQRTILNRLVDALPPDQRYVIVRRFTEQASASEIARELGRSEGAVKQLQFRALQTLRTRAGGIHDKPVAP